MTGAGGAPPALRFALDARGDILAPIDWTGVLCQTDANCEFQGFPPPQLIKVLFPGSLGSGLDPNGVPSIPGEPLIVAGSECCSSQTLQGKELPPLFDPSASRESLSLFGSTDAVQTVIRVQLRAPGRCASVGAACFADVDCATGEVCDLSVPDVQLGDLDYCLHPNACEAPGAPALRAPLLPPSGGPAQIPSSLYAASKEGFVPLATLNLCRDSDKLTCVLHDEQLAGGVDANADGDGVDPSVIELIESSSGKSLPIGLGGTGIGATLLFEPPAPVGPFAVPYFPAPTGPSVRPLVAAERPAPRSWFRSPGKTSPARSAGMQTGTARSRARSSASSVSTRRRRTASPRSPFRRRARPASARVSASRHGPSSSRVLARSRRSRPAASRS